MNFENILLTIIFYVAVLILVLSIGSMVFIVICFAQRGWNGSHMRDFIHNVMDYHVPENHVSFNGASFRSTCNICKKTILLDSQGNWFSI